MEINTQPVAWMTEDGMVYGMHETRPVNANIPLYTSDSPSLIKSLEEELAQTKRKYKNMHNLATQAMSQIHQWEKDKQKEYK